MWWVEVVFTGGPELLVGEEGGFPVVLYLLGLETGWVRSPVDFTHGTSHQSLVRATLAPGTSATMHPRPYTPDTRPVS